MYPLTVLLYFDQLLLMEMGAFREIFVLLDVVFERLSKLCDRVRGDNESFTDSIHGLKFERHAGIFSSELAGN
jgi:hypothetical protein